MRPWPILFSENPDLEKRGRIRFFSLLAGIILALSVTAAHGAETLACKYKEKFKDGGSRGAALELTVEGGEVTGIDYNNTIASGKEGGGYLCALDAKASDGKSVWTRKKDLTVVELPDFVTFEKSTFEIRKSPKGYVSSVDMSPIIAGSGWSSRLRSGSKEAGRVAA